MNPAGGGGGQQSKDGGGSKREEEGCCILVHYPDNNNHLFSGRTTRQETKYHGGDKISSISGVATKPNVVVLRNEAANVCPMSAYPESPLL